MAHLPPLHWNFCLHCDGLLTKQQIADDDSYCSTCIDLLVGVYE